jgi:putative addiction module antidote
MRHNVGATSGLVGYNISRYRDHVPIPWDAEMVRKQTLKKIGGSVATVLPKSMLERFHLEAGDEVFVVETPKGLLVTPFDPEFEEAMEVYARGAKKFRNAMRQLAK